MANANRKKHGFAYGMLSYAVFFLCIVIGALSVFWRFLGAFEMTRVDTALDKYVEELDVERVKAASSDFVASLNSDIQDPNEAYAAIEELVGDKIDVKKNTNLSTDNKMVYMLVANGKTIGKATFVKDGEEIFGMTPWKFEKDEFDVSFLRQDGYSFTVPNDYKVVCNGYTLDESYTTGAVQEFDYLEDFYDNPEYDLPRMVTYEVNNYVGELNFEYYDRDGSEVDVNAAIDVDERLDNCTDEQKAKLEKFIDQFIHKYYNFTATQKGMVFTTYGELSPLLLENSELSKLMYNTIEAMTWAQNKGGQFTGLDIHRMVYLGSDWYLCDLTYTADVVTGTGDTIVSETNARVIVKDTDKGMRASKIMGY